MSKIVITIDTDGNVPDIQYVTEVVPPPREEFPPLQQPGAAQCRHGAMIHKAGTNKAGKLYSGFFCPEDACLPVWDKKR